MYKAVDTLPTVLFWFEDDLRLTDNAALTAAAQVGPILPIFILDEGPDWWSQKGAASKVWLHNSLSQLNHSLHNKLNLFKGSAQKLIPFLCQEAKINHVMWNERIHPYARIRDQKIMAILRERGIQCTQFSAPTLWPHNQLLTSQGMPYKIFGAYYKKCLHLPQPTMPLPRPNPLCIRAPLPDAHRLQDLDLLPSNDWGSTLIKLWPVGEEGATNKLQDFILTSLPHYAQDRDYPARNHTSQLSPHLQFGEITPRTIWHAVSNAVATSPHETENTRKFLSELVWHDFSQYLLLHFPRLAYENFSQKLDHFPWEEDLQILRKWQSGTTGIPLVDAGMRQLWHTGYLHNRVRMIIASFLTKNLRIHWLHGAKWFWDCLVDANLASNSINWQWVAGCGVDAAPFFRIFNPVSQNKKFDPDGAYIRRFIPELSSLPLPYLFAPWTAPSFILKQAGITLGQTYPYPIVDITASRQETLRLYHMRLLSCQT